MHPFVRSVYRALWPSAAYDATPPIVPGLADPAALLFSKTNGFRHFEAISTGAAAFRDIASSRGWSMFHTENGAVFDEDILPRFRVVVWHNASGAPLDEAQRRALRNWLEAGGGFVGVHAALDNSHASWDWYTAQVVGAVFMGHPLDHQSALVRVERMDHPSTRDLPSSWVHFDELYSFDRSVRDDRGVEVLASLDESTYEPRFKLLFLDEDLSMGDHPAIWTRSVGAGRAVLCALGHVAKPIGIPDSDLCSRVRSNGLGDWTPQGRNPRPMQRRRISDSPERARQIERPTPFHHFESRERHSRGGLGVNFETPALGR